ncbi:MAG: PhzF family phenazine biosynthesis protein [Spirochaetales bacterium]|nr:PhzF family phenazine biosynthesis protein [Spirochaetales bacterium]
MDNWQGGRIFQVDSFTSEPFKGNPAGVVFLQGHETEEWMQNMAGEMNLSETAFLLPREGGYAIRFFTPTTEVPLCGHATLASAHILYEQQVVKEGDRLNFFAAAGELVIQKEADWIEMDFPVYGIRPVPVDPVFAGLVGFKPLEMYKTDYSFTIAVAESESQVLEASPRLGELEAHDMGDLLITAKSDREGSDFVLRCFAPMHGIDEDPVTGSAHCVLVPLWHEKTGEREFVSRQLSSRGGVLRTEMTGERVKISGQGVTVFEGRLSR